MITELIYKATVDGFGQLSYNTKCNGKGPLIMLIRTNTQQTYGAYFSITYESSKNQYKQDSESFLFQVEKKSKMKSKAGQSHIWCGTGYHIWLGSNELVVCDNSNINEGSNTNLGQAYEAPPGVSYGTAESKNYMSNAERWKNLEIEIY